MTHNERVLGLLSDGKPHSHMELYRLGVVAHSRIADLRRRGHTIECWRQDDLYLYQLADLTERGGDDGVSGTDPGTPGVRLRGTAVQAPDTPRSVSSVVLGEPAGAVTAPPAEPLMVANTGGFAEHEQLAMDAA